MIGYREPGYLWKIKSTPTIWGPVGGFTTIPFLFLKEFSLKNKFGWVLKNCLNVLQSIISFRIRRATHNFSQIVGATPIDVKRLNVLCNSEKVIHIPETGSYQSPLKKTEIEQNKKLKIIWIGKFDERKALPLALKAISFVTKTEKIELNIFGDGDNQKKYLELASKLELINVCNWYGNVSKIEVHNALRTADLLFFTSVQDATSSVVLEALSFGVPVLCHDANGYGAIIDESCGFKIPFKSPTVSVSSFGNILNNLVERPEILAELSTNASKQSEKHSWNEHAKEMVHLYHQLLTNNSQF
jgi:glycosyltransferase involved in cell wall biosynthesis